MDRRGILEALGLPRAKYEQTAQHVVTMIDAFQAYERTAGYMDQVVYDEFAKDVRYFLGILGVK
jgi:hypothetical protein